jgi:tRNA nucleotidyltransferase/poly(A) polymerase
MPRILRAVRFANRFDFKMDPRTLRLLSSSLSLLNEISGPRLRHELDLILLEFNVGTALRAMDRLSILEVINPNLTWNPALEAHTPRVPEPACNPRAEWKTETHESQLILRQVRGLLLLVWKTSRRSTSNSSARGWRISQRGSSPRSEIPENCAAYCRTYNIETQSGRAHTQGRFSIALTALFTKARRTLPCASLCACT